MALTAAVAALIAAAPASAAVMTFHVQDERGIGQLTYVDVSSPFVGNYRTRTDPYGDVSLTVNGNEALKFTRDGNPGSAAPNPDSCKAPEDATGGLGYTVPPSPTSETVTITLQSATGPAYLPELSAEESWVVAKLNEARAAHGIAPLHISTTLTAAADAIAHDLQLSRAGGGYAFPAPYCLVALLGWGWPTGNFLVEDSGFAEPWRTLAHWDGTEGSAESTNLANAGALNDFFTAVGVADGGGAWIVEYNTCPASGADRCGMTELTGDASGYTPPLPPEVAITGPDQLTGTSATLRGTVNPRGRSVSDCAFELQPAGAAQWTRQACAEPVGAGSDPVVVSAAFTLLQPDTTYSYRLLATSDRGTVTSAPGSFTTGAITATLTPTPTPTPTPSGGTSQAVPPPQPGKTADAGPVSGTVYIKTPGGKFVPLAADAPIPLGSEIDATKGVVRISTAPAPGQQQDADFSAGRFVLAQVPASAKPHASQASALVTELRLSGPQPRLCTRKAHASKAKTRRLWGDGKGAFRTVGRFSAATVRGTKWLVEDRCDGTLTRVARGTVRVDDFVSKRVVSVTAPHKYLAKAKGGTHAR